MDFRELLAGGKQWKSGLELTSERLSQMFARGKIPAGKRVGADGARPLQRGGYKAIGPYLMSV